MYNQEYNKMKNTLKI